MNKITITPFDLDKDFKEICDWDKKYGNEPCFYSIRKYILEGNIYYNLGEVIELNYEKVPIGNNERHDILAIKNEENKLIGFTINCVFDIIKNPTLFIQYIVIHPLYQNKGYGTKYLTEIFENPEIYFGVSPKEVLTNIEMSNLASLQLFKNMGFKISMMPPSNHYVRADKTLLEPNNEKE